MGNNEPTEEQRELIKFMLFRQNYLLKFARRICTVLNMKFIFHGKHVKIEYKVVKDTIIIKVFKSKVYKSPAFKEFVQQIKERFPDFILLFV